MAQRILRSFAELAEALSFDSQAESFVPERDPECEPLASLSEVRGLHELLTDIERAGATLMAIARRDEEARTRALSQLEQYDQQMEQLRQSGDALEGARRLVAEAHNLVETAFAQEAREAATQVLRLAERAEAESTALVQEHRQALDSLTEQLDIQRLLVERQRMQEEEKRKAAEAGRARRLSTALAGAQAALNTGRIEEAKALLGPARNENPDNAEIASLLDSIAQREIAVKIDAAEETLRQTRREYRHDPETAVRHFEDLDVNGLPEELARQAFGEWVRACRYLCRSRQIDHALRYGVGPGRGAVLVVDEAGQHVVVSAMGMPDGWVPGTPVAEHLAARALPLSH